MSDKDVKQESEPSLSAAERMARFHEQMRLDEAGVADFVETLPFRPDPFQLEALEAYALGSSVLVSAPTGSGKTVVGEGAVYLALKRGERAFYTTPIKALSNQKFHDFQQRFGAQEVGLLTGDTSINPDASVVVMTTEVLRNMIYAGRDLSSLGVVVLDEIHYLADRVRGPVWEEIIIELPPAIQIVALSATVSNADEFGAWIAEVRSDCVVVRSNKRPVPLYQQMIVRGRLYDLFAAEVREASAAQTKTRIAPGRLNPELLDALHREDPRSGPRRVRPARPVRHRIVETLERRSLLPAIVFIFSRAGCEEAVRQLLRADLWLTTRSEQDRIREVADQTLNLIPAADHHALGLGEWAEALERGIAAHHAGMLPLLKETVEQLFAAGLVKVVYATETLALGINMPARTVVIESLEKWNGSEHVRLSPGEYTQLTGRAGRRGIDTEGHAVVLSTSGASPEEVAQLASRRSYPLKSAFYPSYNTVVNLLSHSTVAATRQVLELSFAQYQADDQVVELAAKFQRAERELGSLQDQLHCSKGDAAEYFKLREDLSRTQKQLAKLNRAGQRDSIYQRVLRLRVGDVVRYQERRHWHSGVVVIPAGRDWGAPSVRVVGENAKFYNVSADSLQELPEVIGHVEVPRTGVRRRQNRSAVARHLREVVSGRRFDSPKRHRPPSTSKEAAHLREAEARLEKEIHAHPVHGCPEREEHAVVGHEWVRTKREVDYLAKQIEERTSSIALEYDKVLQVLRNLKFVEGETVTHKGELLRRVFGERDLLVTECVSAGILAGLTPDELAALSSALVYEPRDEKHLSPTNLPTYKLETAWEETLQAFDRVHRNEKKVGLDRTAAPAADLVGATYLWARGGNLSEAMEESGLSAGDFVRWMRQTIDLLEQLRWVGSRELRDRTESAIGRLRRGVVEWIEVI